MRYRLVCFDAGFTLIEPRATMAQLLGGVLGEQGVTPTEDALHRAWTAADEWFWEEYHRPENDTWVSDERINETWRQYHRLMLTELGIDDPEHRIVDAVVEAQLSARGWQLYPDVAPAIGELRSAGVRMGVVSDWGSQLPAIIHDVGLGDAFEFVLASAMAGHAKPMAAFFRIALERTDVAAVDALMVGDSYPADVAGARAAGMAGVLLDRTGTSGVTDVPVIRSLAELPALVRDG